MEYFRSLGSRPTPHESTANERSSVVFEDHEESQSVSSSSVPTPVEDLNVEVVGQNRGKPRSSVSNGSRGDFLSSPVTKSTTFVPVDDLPIHFSSGGPGRTNMVENQTFSVGVGEVPSRFSQMGQAPGSVFGTFPIHQDIFIGGGDCSIRRLSGVENITSRESKRPKERNKDKEYRRLTLTRSDMPPVAPPELDSVGIQHQDYGLSSRHAFPSPPVPSPFSSGPSGVSRTNPNGESSSTSNSPFDIKLVYEGRSVLQRVSERFSVGYLVYEASAIFGIHPDSIQLMVFSMFPTMLDRAKTLLGPPRVTPNSSVFVFRIPGPPAPRNMLTSRDQELHSIDSGFTSKIHSQLLGTFKLPKFDGTPKAWKQWDRDFVRFLGLHQLEHVLREDFPSLLPDPAAVASNKIVYFLVEEAVLPGTLASKYVRQAPLWHGHQAYVLLYNGFVFTGAQTATVLMAELSHMRFLPGETGSAFCLRLIELLEELEHIPGSAAVVLNDTQKLGYLLSAIRHEKDLSVVYTQLQTDQLRGKVTFEQACQELHFRCEAIRADTLLDTQFRPTRALVSTEIKHVDKEKVLCLAKGCTGMIVAFLPLC